MADEPRVLGINHIGLAAKDPAKAKWFLGEVLGLAGIGEELVVDQQTLTVMYAAGEGAAGGSRLEILVPGAPGAGPIAKYLEKKGGGIHHLALTVDGLVPLLARLRSAGVRLIDETPRPGAHRTRIAFVHPESTGGLLIELVEAGS